jgi:SAM-dependent methyltransferase
MNQAHLRNLSSPERARWLQAELVPWLEETQRLGDDVLEIGPGPGLTTDLLRVRVASVTALESDPVLAEALAMRLAGTNVAVIEGDAVKNGLPSGRFSAVCCFSMLHHALSVELQDQVFTEITRGLRPSGWLFGEDPLDSAFARLHHIGDTFVPLDPETLERRLEVAGLSNVGIQTGGSRIKFSAAKA